ncbi:TRAP transporter small permease subunit [Ruegeria faecimaris]|uniref:TRAP transporter small permease protein n=1 Tax=Ruegeria faecimaris TaxID=686389 RepID=A0A521DRV2_9RHOB|nr:TRAP transporter small permease subunit [Ruegeria faecimaris]SMO74473.1 TRAP-type mannitol/chloroaromatic compound transport system, small permease component [Ruegeria faecimaris]
MTTILRVIDAIAGALALLGRCVIFALIVAMLYEVVARYAFGAPTLWAFDISYMLNGSVFLLGAAYALRCDVHVRIDFLSQRMPMRAQQLLNGAVFLLVMTPITTIFAWVASKKAWKALITGEVESVSPWAPVVWPFYTVIAVGLAALALQFLAEAIKLLSGRKNPGEAPGELDGMEENQ